MPPRLAAPAFLWSLGCVPGRSTHLGGARAAQMPARGDRFTTKPKCPPPSLPLTPHPLSRTCSEQVPAKGKAGSKGKLSKGPPAKKAKK